MLTCNEYCLTLGCTTTSKELILGLCAFEDGLHVLEWEWLGAIHAVQIPAIKGEPFIFRNPFNESAITRFRIYQPTLGLYHDCDNHFCFELYMAPGFVHSEKNSIFETLYGECQKWTINGTRYTAIRQGDGVVSPITLKICS